MTHTHANAGTDFAPRARCGVPLTYTASAAAVPNEDSATNNPNLVTCPDCLARRDYEKRSAIGRPLAGAHRHLEIAMAGFDARRRVAQ